MMSWATLLLAAGTFALVLCGAGIGAAVIKRLDAHKEILDTSRDLLKVAVGRGLLTNRAGATSVEDRYVPSVDVFCTKDGGVAIRLGDHQVRLYAHLTPDKADEHAGIIHERATLAARAGGHSVVTCVAAWCDGRQAVMGADSAGVAGYDLTTRRDPKVFRLSLGGEPALIGFTTSFRMGQILRFYLSDALAPRGTKDPYEYLVCDVTTAARSVLSDHGYLRKSDNREYGGTWLVAFAGGLYRIEGDMQVGEAAGPFDAIGCGRDLALGALACADQKTLRARVRRALEVAGEFNAGVCGPFRTASVTWRAA